jgi:myosin heavy subunit
VFNKQVFEAELKLFKEENILCALDDCPDNLPCVQILSAKGGVLDILNAQCGAIQPSEDKFVRDLTKEHKTNNFFPPVHRKDAKDSFKILHFAGPVQYTVGGWLLKNSDPLPESMAQVFSSGSLKLVSRILRDEISKSQAQSDTKAKKVKSTTVSQAFVKSMKSLTEELSQTKCNFIRCIKPNPQMRPGIFNRLYVVDQLRCLGILATCEVLKAGMPTRVTYKELMNALGNLPPATLDLFAGQPEEVLIAASMWAFEVPADAYQLGRTRVFFKAGEISRVESMLKTDLSGPAGEGINERMKIALERRQKALEAVLGVEALMNKAKPGVDVASQLLEDVEDTLRQINRDFATSSDVMSKSITAASKDVKDRTEMTAALNKLKNDPKLSMAEEADSVISIAEEVSIHWHIYPYVSPLFFLFFFFFFY